jgi:hypothetical protein
VGIYNTPTTERKFSEFIDVQEVKEPLLRASFEEGGAEVVDTIHKDKDMQMINRLMWQSFDNYTWETNQEQDNPLFAGLLIEEGNRFGSPLDGKRSYHYKTSKQKWKSNVMCIPYFVDSEMQQDADIADFMVDVEPGADVPTSGKAMERKFHNVFLPSWDEIPEPSPWNQFTATEGTQIPDSYLKNPSKVTCYDWPRFSSQNRWISIRNLS